MKKLTNKVAHVGAIHSNSADFFTMRICLKVALPYIGNGNIRTYVRHDYESEGRGFDSLRAHHLLSK